MHSPAPYPALQPASAHPASAARPFPPPHPQQPSPHALHIATAAATAAAHAPEPEEQTAHPLRPRGQHALPADAEGEPAPESIADAMTHGPGPHGGLTRPLTHKERELINHLDRLKFFLATAPSRWSADDPATAAAAAGLPIGHPSSTHPALNRFLLPNSEYVSCVLWGGLYHITGTDIVRALVFRFEAFGRPVRNMKKFEEGVFSDLRNLKPGLDACLEEPKSPFLDLLFKYQCIRTQKKQKVFYWFSVPHDRLFLDALERDLKREKMGMEPTTVVVGEPALSFTYDSKRSLYEQYSKPQSDSDGEDDGPSRTNEQGTSESDGDSPSTSGPSDAESEAPKKAKATKFGPASPFFSMFSLFEGSPTYKQRRKKLHRTRRTPPDAFSMDNYMGRMREPHVDRFGRDTTRMSAGDLFMAQARGDFDGQSNPDLIAPQKERQRRALEAQFALANRQRYADPARAGSMPQSGLAQDMHASMMMEGGQPSLMSSFPGHMPQRPMPHSRHTFPNADLPHHARSISQPFAGSSGVPFVDVDAWQGAAAPDMLVDSGPRAKAFVCPLFSCGRMFKRMEHLKRHVRTHTLERPYQCDRCQKRFSRSDNLAQHVRTHLRAEEGGDPGPDADQEPEEGDPDVSMGDAQMYEVELQGPVHEIQGDEEGLVMAAAVVPACGPADEMQEGGYYQAPPMNPSPEQGNFMHAEGSPGSQWATVRPHSSMSYTGGQPMRMSPPTFGLSSDYGLSLSAPSHRATFDHGALYPPELDVGGPGPIRRHRSVTPARYGENIRRPYSVASDHGVPVGRSFHPYAHAYSAESSPMAATVPLGYGGAPPVAGLSRGHSRAGSAAGSGAELQDQMRQMMSLQQPEMDVEQHTQAAATAYMRDPMLTAYSAPFRTDSPMQYATTAGNEYELVNMNMLQSEDPAQPVPMYGLYGLPEGQGDHYAPQGPGPDASYAAFAHGDPQQVLM